MASLVAWSVEIDMHAPQFERVVTLSEANMIRLTAEFSCWRVRPHEDISLELEGLTSISSDYQCAWFRSIMLPILAVALVLEALVRVVVDEYGRNDDDP